MVIPLAAILSLVPFNVQLEYPGDQEGKGAGLTDFGCLAVATTPLDISGNSQILLAAYDDWGWLFWADSVHWGTSSEVLSVQPWSGGLVITGAWSGSAGGLNGVALALNGDGSQAWTYHLEMEGTERFTSSAQGSDGTLVCVGSTNSQGAGGNDLLMVGLDDEGHELWRKVYGTVGEEAAYHVSPCSDGGYIVAGQAMDWGAGLGDYWVLRTDSQGDTLWTGTYGGDQFDYPWRAVQCGENYYVAGNTLSYGAGSYDWWVLKLDSSGEVVWDAVWGQRGTDTNMALTVRDGLPVVAGMSEVTGSGFLGCVVVFDGQGDPLEEWYYDPGMIRSIDLLPGGGFLMSGTGVGDAGDIAVRCVDSDGITPPLGIGTTPTPASSPVVFPNPAFRSATVRIPSGTGSIRVYDIVGRLVLEAEAAGGSAELDLSSFEEGVYAVVLQGEASLRLTVVR